MSETKKLFLSWDDFEKDTKSLSVKLKKAGKWDKIICITRGGLAPSALLSRYLDIKFIDTICLSSYDEKEKQGQVQIIKGLFSTSDKILVVDDLVDTGKSFIQAKEFFPNAHFCCAYAKPLGKQYVNTYQVDIPQSTWIVFPWEK